MRIRGVAFVVLAAAVLIVGYLSFRDYLQRCTLLPSIEDDGVIASRVLSIAFKDNSRLNVRSAKGTVRTVVEDRNIVGITTKQISKAPFTVDYFVNLGRIKGSDIRWDGQERRLMIRLPEVDVAAVNVDEANRYVVDTRGFWVGRRAGERLSKMTSNAAVKTAQAEADKPENLMVARESARKAIVKFLKLPLAAAQLKVNDIQVAFPGERFSRDGERWDRSRSLEEVYGGG